MAAKKASGSWYKGIGKGQYQATSGKTKGRKFRLKKKGQQTQAVYSGQKGKYRPMARTVHPSSLKGYKPPAAYDPYTTFKTQDEFNKRSEQIAQQGIAPQLANLGSEQRTEEAKHGGRVHDISGMSAQLTKELNDAFAETQRALSEVMATQGQSDAATNQAMQAALAASAAGDQQLGGIVGGQVPGAGTRANIAQTGIAGRAAGTTAVNRDMGRLLAESAGRQSLGALAGARSLDVEGARNTTAMRDIQGRRRDLNAQLPGLRAQAREELAQQALQGANTRFQQQMAEKEFGQTGQNLRFQQGLAKQTLGETVRSNKAQEKLEGRKVTLASQNQAFQKWLAKQNLGLEFSKFTHQKNLDQATLNLQRDKLIADVKIAAGNQDIQRGEIARQAGAEAAKLAGKRWDNGRIALEGYLATPKGWKQKDWARTRRYRDAWNMLRHQVRLGPKEAARLLLAVNLPGWQARSRWVLRGNSLGSFPTNPRPQARRRAKAKGKKYYDSYSGKGSKIPPGGLTKHRK